MKYTIALLILSLTFYTVSCSKGVEAAMTDGSTRNNTGNNNQAGNKMKITIGSVIFTASLNDNVTVTAFKAMLPLTINMSDLNANEKFFYFSTILPTNASPGGSIRGGDLMLYGNNCLVLFYESFNTSYSYTRLGRVDNNTGLASTLGLRNVVVRFELE